MEEMEHFSIYNFVITTVYLQTYSMYVSLKIKGVIMIIIIALNLTATSDDFNTIQAAHCLYLTPVITR